MLLKTLSLVNFRNYENASVMFDSGLNTLFGDNAQGKTNLLEAVFLLVAGKSFRTPHLKECIRSGASHFLIEAQIVTRGVEQTLQFFCDGKQNKFFHNTTPYRSYLPLIGLVQGTLLSPDDYGLIKGLPAQRRSYLNLQLCQADPLYLHHLVRYHKALQQRNCLLRDHRVETLPQWEEQMSLAAGYLTVQRFHVVQKLNQKAQIIQEWLSDRHEALQLCYKWSHQEEPNEAQVCAYYRERWEQTRSRELVLGNTLSGPHRDDLLIHLNGKEARDFASEGQIRCIIAALRLAEWQLLQETTGEVPLMGIDDIGISLDPKRLERLYTQLLPLGQVFLSSPTAPLYTAYSHLIHVYQGTVNTEIPKIQAAQPLGNEQ